MSDYATNMSKSIVHTTKRLTQMIDEVRQKQAQEERDEIIKMAKQAHTHHINWDDDYIEGLERFAALVAAAERDAICPIVYGRCGSDNDAQRIVDAIRARGEK
jgi:metal-responsive CopG/Arc/MetJ family transcriptional regulator